MKKRFRFLLGFVLVQTLTLLRPQHLFGAAEAVVASPDGSIQFKLVLDASRASYSVTLKNSPVIESSPIVFTLDGIDLIDGVQQIGSPEKSQINETFPSRWVHSKGTNHCNVTRFNLKNSKSGTPFQLEVSRLRRRRCVPHDRARIG